MYGRRRLSSPTVPAPPVPSSLALWYAAAGTPLLPPLLRTAGTPPPPSPEAAASLHSCCSRLPAVATLLLPPVTPLHHQPPPPASPVSYIWTRRRTLIFLPNLGGKGASYSLKYGRCPTLWCHLRGPWGPPPCWLLDFWSSKSNYSWSPKAGPSSYNADTTEKEHGAPISPTTSAWRVDIILSWEQETHRSIERFEA